MEEPGTGDDLIGDVLQRNNLVDPEPGAAKLALQLAPAVEVHFHAVDAAVSHPAIAQVVTFAMPHDKLGEDVAAAIVLRDGSEATEREIRDFCAGRLADFKVPRRIVILPEIPKGATGKLQRIGLAAKLGLG